jgi:hypothetical protein
MNTPRDREGKRVARVPGPGPKDAGKGAAGQEMIDRVEGGPEKVPDPDEADARPVPGGGQTGRREAARRDDVGKSR